LHGVRKYCLIIVAFTVIASCATAAQAQQTLSLSLKPDRLANALRDLSIQAQTGLLFSPDLVGERLSPAVVRAASIEQALRVILAGSGLAFERTAAGTIIIFADPDAPLPPAIPEILVTGRKTQNVDIARSQNDIQPYQVITAADIDATPADTVDQLLRTRLPEDAEASPPSLNGLSMATNRSEINLNGLGANQTTILVDGARMPGVPAAGNVANLFQADLNGIPLIAIERIETLTATAGGIYGPGSTGGMVNVVLKRDYRGIDLNAEQGLSGQGDAMVWRIEGRVGFTPDKGQTDVMVVFSHTTSTGLPFASRDYPTGVRANNAASSPASFALSHVTNGLLVRSLGQGNLSLRPGLGGQSLGSTITYLPAGGTGVGVGAVAVANAGNVAAGIPLDASGTQDSLTDDTSVTSLLFSARHRFSDRIEGFADFIDMRNDGLARGGAAVADNVVLATAAGNPFAQNVLVTTTTPGFNSVETNRLRTWRFTGGAIVRLPGGWQGEGNFSLGGVRYADSLSGFALNKDFSAAVSRDVPGAAGEPAPNPFGNWASYVAALQAYKIPSGYGFVLRDQFRDATIRFAGPLVTTGAGTTALTLLAERRTESTPDASEATFAEAGSHPLVWAGFEQAVSSLYGELRAPLVARDHGFAPLRGLELQLALRFDSSGSRAPQSTSTVANASTISVRQDTLAYTAGLRLFPLRQVMLRASLATGSLPPTAQQLRQTAYLTFSGALDPLRGDTRIGNGKDIIAVDGGSANLKAETARTLSAGFVVNPDGGRRPRVSVDYTHIDKHNEISTAYQNDFAYFMANTSLYPGRVTRAPLTAQDMAAGYTGGVVTQIDTTALNIGRTRLDAVDMNANWRLPISARDTLGFRALATWQPRLTRQLAPGLPAMSYVGFDDGPLKWRGNAGIDWEHGQFNLNVNGQFYNRYVALPAAAASDLRFLTTPGYRIPAQAYADMVAAYRMELPPGSLARDVRFRMGVGNLLNTHPPIVNDTVLGYSPYGDARGRRFDLAISMHY